MQYLIKIVLSAVLITIISEIAKRSSFWGAITASLPFISILAFVFLYHETKDLQKVSNLSADIFWLVIPSLALFLALPYLIKRGIEFYSALGISILITIVAYFLLTNILQYFKIL